jgi:hypothetical protein
MAVIVKASRRYQINAEYLENRSQKYYLPHSQRKYQGRCEG